MNYDVKGFWGTSDEDEEREIAQYVRNAATVKYATPLTHDLHPECRFTARMLWEQGIPVERAARILTFIKLK